MSGANEIALLDGLLTTTRTTRRRLDFQRPVPLGLLEECLAVAVQAPNGGNRQDWHFVIVDDPALKDGIAEHYRAAATDYQSGRPDSPGLRSAKHLTEHFHEVPAFVLACTVGRLAQDAGAQQAASFHGSLYPAVWSFMLAASARGLGTALTTLHLRHERAVAELLGIPYDDVQQGPLIAVGYRRGERPGPAPRRPLAEVMSVNGWRREAP